MGPVQAAPMGPVRACRYTVQGPYRCPKCTLKFAHRICTDTVWVTVRGLYPYKHCLKCQNWASSGPLWVAMGQCWPGSGPLLALKAMFMGTELVWGLYDPAYTGMVKDAQWGL